MRNSVIFLAVLAFGAASTVSCAEGNKPPANIGNAKQCAELGGEWVRAGMMDHEQCDMPAGDAGKTCTDNSECESFCAAPEGASPGSEVTGTCYKSHLVVGTCLARVVKGRAEPALCVD